MTPAPPGPPGGHGLSGPQVTSRAERASIRTAIRVEGVVQGVGFRPFVYSLANALGLAGLVGNDVDGVFAEVEGDPEAVREFLVALERDAPPLARVERVTATAVAPTGAASFAIVPSDPTGRRSTLIAADTATCADCLRELADPADRRFRYPFINCTNCGPRFTIVRDVPYDRPLTTMAGFAMCAECAAEYHDPANRRFHAQPTCCPACGPRLTLLDRSGEPVPDIAVTAPGSAAHDPRAVPDGEPVPDPLPPGLPPPDPAPPGGAPPDAAFGAGPVLAAAAALLRQGAVVAVKGLGGYHLAADATCEPAVAALRARKHREDKPFAIMTADLAAARRLCRVDDAEAALLTSPARPVVLLARHPDADVAASVAPGNRQLGIMLPYTPLHHLLLSAVARPLVLTSGNVSDEPIAYRDDDAMERLGGIADAFVSHDRAIHIRTDDSVARALRGRPALIRRSRGYVPEPVTLRTGFPRPVLACGAELKNTFCLAKGRRAFVSHHIGDLKNAETFRSFTEGIEHFSRIFDIVPQVVAYDLHPEYLSTKYALDRDGVDLVGVQHHHAHIASCLADNGLDGSTGGPVIGVAFDGTGYGPDGTIWGGEFLVADLAGFRRAGHLAPVPMPGGAAAIRQPWRMAAAYLDQIAAPLPAGPAGPPGQIAAKGPAGSSAQARAQTPVAGLGAASRAAVSAASIDAGSAHVPAAILGAGRADARAVGFDVAGLAVAQRNAARWEAVLGVARRRVNAPLTSSAGRLFDAVAAILGVRDEIHYEGQAAIELEQLADPAETAAYPSAIETAASEAGTFEMPGTPAQGSGSEGPFLASGADLIRAVADDLTAGVSREIIAARFHSGLADLIVDGCELLRDRHGLSTVALSGGVFQNLLLLRHTVTRLEARGFTVLTHSRVPCNDGGISLGQAVIAAARDSAAGPRFDGLAGTEQ